MRRPTCARADSWLVRSSRIARILLMRRMRWRGIHGFKLWHGILLYHHRPLANYQGQLSLDLQQAAVSCSWICVLCCFASSGVRRNSGMWFDDKTMEQYRNLMVLEYRWSLYFYGILFIEVRTTAGRRFAKPRESVAGHAGVCESAHMSMGV
jgi:hypothetical protein